MELRRPEYDGDVFAVLGILRQVAGALLELPEDLGIETWLCDVPEARRHGLAPRRNRRCVVRLIEPGRNAAVLDGETPRHLVERHRPRSGTVLGEECWRSRAESDDRPSSRFDEVVDEAFGTPQHVDGRTARDVATLLDRFEEEPQLAVMENSIV